MALVKFGNGIAGMSGKVAGNVFARNKAGAYVRNWAKPTTTPTIKQSQNRARFGNQSAAWGALASSQRDAWNASAQGQQRINRMGDPYVPTGRQIFLASNNQLVAVAQDQILDVPADFVPPEISPDIVITSTVDTGEIDTILMGPTGVDATLVYSVEATGQIPDIKQNLTNVYRYLGTVSGSATNIPLNVLWSNAYGITAAVGNVIWFRVKTVTKANGMASSALIIKSVLG